MGSAVSSNVKRINIDDHGVVKKIRPGSRKRVGSSSSQPACSRCSSGKNSPEFMSQADCKNKSLEKQLSESESQRLDLEDKFQFLKDELSYVNSQSGNQEQERSWQAEIESRDKDIADLMKQSEVTNQDFDKFRERHRTKVRSLLSKLTEMKHEASIEIMELKDEISRLTEQHQFMADKLEKIQGKQMVSKMSKQNADGGEPNTPCSSAQGEHGKEPPPNSVYSDITKAVILELSEQISEQSYTIGNLEQQLAEKTNDIRRLKKRLQKRSMHRKQKFQPDSNKSSDSAVLFEKFQCVNISDHSSNEDDNDCLTDASSTLFVSSKSQAMMVPETDLASSCIREISGISQDSGTSSPPISAKKLINTCSQSAMLQE